MTIFIKNRLQNRVGTNFLLQKSIIILGTLLRNFSFTKAQDKPGPKPFMTVTLRLESGV
tara:strand:- start:74 stop:250 length:177 start_codon:yes stop_codon:yes gene_type:complete